MADIDQGLPVRTEEDGLDGRLHAKLVDGVTPSQMATVDTDLDLHVKAKLRDNAGADFGTVGNPVNVAEAPPSGTRVHDFNEATAIAAAATSDHDYSVANGVTHSFYGFKASASGRMKIEVQIGDGAASEAFTTKAICFNSVADPNISENFQDLPISVVGTVNTTTIKIIRTNLDKKAQDVHSMIVGLEV